MCCALMSFAAQRTHSDPFFANLGVFKFSDMVHCHNVLFLHKVFHNILPASIHTTYAISPMPIRHMDLILAYIQPTNFQLDKLW